MEGKSSSGTLIPFYKPVWHSIPEGSNFGAAVSTSHLTIKLPYTVSYLEDGGGMLVPVYQITRRHIPEDCNLDANLCQNIKSQRIGRLTVSMFR